MDYSTAAIAVRDALVTDAGRVKSVDHWKKTAAEALGIGKLFQARWDSVLEAGESLSLFTIDTATFSYPVLKLIESPEVVDELVPIEIEVIEPTPIPGDWNPPQYMDCGHLDLWQSKEGCSACARRAPPNYRFLRGDFVRPIPEKRRRGPHRSSAGFPGLCTNSDGFYIGGVANDCRQTGAVRCGEHA